MRRFKPAVVASSPNDPVPLPLAVPPAEVATAASQPIPAPAAAPVQAPRSGSAQPAPGMPTPGRADDPDVDQVGCATCGEHHSYYDGPFLHGGCAGGSCIPGRPPCYLPAKVHSTFIGEFCSNLYECLCCPDPCYQPKWVPAANSGFFLDYARPRTVTRVRYEHGWDMVLPDRNEYFYKVQQSFPGTHGKKTPFIFQGKRYQADPSLNFSQLYLYQEAAAKRGSFFIEIPYRQINPLFSPTRAGFSDLNLGTKALLFDCEMFQFSFQFRTYLPTGNAMQGLGTGHVSLEPSLLASLRLGPETYLQAQLAQWIPLGGTTNIAGGILGYFFSLNQVLYHFTPDTMLIGNVEFDGWSFQNGGATNPIVYPGFSNRISSNDDTYFNMGPGLRMSVCNGLDFGGAITWALTNRQWADPWFRLEIRFLY